MQERIGDIEIISASYLGDVKRASPSPALRTIVAARTPVEETIAEIWREILNQDTLSVLDNFFELGGDSLQAGQVLARARDVFGVEPPFQEMFENATIAGMAEKIEAALQRGQTSPAPPIERAPRDRPLPLSFSQERMWFIHQLDPQSAAYNIGGAARMRRPFDLDAFRWTIEQLVLRHEVLRTAFPTVDGQPVQVILPPQQWELPVIDLRNVPASERIARVTELAEADVRAPFDLSQAPLFKTRVYRLGEDDLLLVFNLHHIISDAWSMGVFAREMFLLQQAYANGKRAELPPLPIQYADFAVWQRQWLQGEVLERHLAYWRDKLRGATVLELPTDRPRPPIQTYHGGTQQFELDPALLAALRELCRAEGVTLFMVLLAAFNTLLYRYTAQADVAVGVPVANRNFVAIENLIGAFVNTLVLRTDLSGSPTFRELLQRVRVVAVEAFAHQDMPFAKLVAELNPERDTSYTPFVQTFFNVINVPMDDAAIPDELRAEFALNRGAAQFDLTCTVTDIRNIHRVIFEYNTDLFDDATIARMLEHFRNLLQAIVAAPDSPIRALPLLSEQERAQLLVEWNATAMPYRADATIHSLFEEQAARTPDATALIFDSQRISFRKLDERANRLANHLQACGVKAETPVALFLERSAELVTAMLGVLKAGGAYVPLDVKYPAERVSFILQDTRAPIILTEQRFVERLPEHTARVVCLDADSAHIAQQSNQKPATPGTSDSLAYIVYTSGSTGVPKGVLGVHRGTTNRLASMAKQFPFAANEVACFKSPVTFVDSILELFAPLACGVPVVILPEAVMQDANAFVDALSNHQVTRLILVPSLLTVLLDTQKDVGARLPQLKYWIAGGEALSAELRDMFYAKLPDAILVNLYGASEASGDSTIHDTRATCALPFVPIGRPIANTQVYLLDDDMQPVPIGVRGELYVGGVSLARGYLNQPQLTQEKFVPSPFGDGLLYRTGDDAAYLPDGNIRYLGRRDRQIKVRGMRVESGEIEAVLRRHPRVGDAAVLLRQDDGREARLVAYVLAPQSEAASDELRAFLRSQLPEHMVPREIVFMDQFPRTSSGKTDRLRFPAPPRPSGARNGKHPGTPIERELVSLWENLLEITPVGLDDDFFELGGHSLLAIRLFADIESKFGQRIPVASIFQAPTIRALAQRLNHSPASTAWSPLVPIQADGSGPAFFCVHGLGGGVMDYVPLARHLKGQSFYGLQAYGLVDRQTPDTTIESMAERYLDAVRQRQAHGPFLLGGYSYGGTVAFEMAQQLIAQGENVALLAMFDHPAPKSGYLTVRLSRNAIRGFLKNLPLWLQDYAQLDPRQQWGRIRRRITPTAARTPGQTDDETVALLEYYLDDVSRVPPAHRALMRLHLDGAAAYEPKPYPGCVTVLRAQRQPLWCSYDPELGWSQSARQVEVRTIAGAHRNLLQEPHVQVLAQELARCIAQAMPR